jgi:hypothetical protein
MSLSHAAQSHPRRGSSSPGGETVEVEVSE